MGLSQTYDKTYGSYENHILTCLISISYFAFSTLKEDKNCNSFHQKILKKQNQAKLL